MNINKKRLTTLNVDEYIKSFPENVQNLLQKIRKTIKAAAPEASEMISYGIAGYKYHGMLVFFAAFADHISVYPAPRGSKEFKNELSDYKGGKGTLQLPLDKPIPLDLIRRITKFRMKANEENFAAKNKKTIKSTPGKKKQLSQPMKKR